MNRLAGALRRTFGVVREHVGTDHFGNKYYIIPKQKTWTGRLVRAKRLVEAANPSEYEYMEGNIPIEWDAWIRGRRKEPPSAEELMTNLSNREQVKLRAQEVDERDQALLEKEIQEGLVATPRTVAIGHASAASFGKETVSEEPTSTAQSFQPGSWMPNPKK
ncbi:NADH dehydrogenase [ubiquinone] 1 alpha subcomplex assembly factor 2 [Eucyclogobius newberryi]|uniref:NADH dehydrogenase [ubiquinone] 1 alpha subcomplex assembly factor 2 n=1 Tax=Eucyclogobius newberryi TaxID=166745 RepID=UPI003B5C5D3F